jgi:hypothetical protein
MGHHPAGRGIIVEVVLEPVGHRRFLCRSFWFHAT